VPPSQRPRADRAQAEGPRLARLSPEDEQFWFGATGAPAALASGRANPAQVVSESTTIAYLLGANDVVDFRIPEYPVHDRQEVVVGPDGKIALDFVGAVSVAGRTPDEVSAELAKGYANYLRRATPRLVLHAPRPREVVVVGPVPTPGRRKLAGQGTLLDILGDAGFGQKAENVRASLSLLRGGRALTLPAREVLALQDPRWNVRLQPDDIVVVHGDDGVLVSGEVRKPGLIQLPASGQLPLTHVLAQAGGVTDDADLEHARISRASGATEDVDLNPILFGDGLVPMLNSGDALSIPTSRQTRVWIFGMVERPGLYRQAGTVRVLQAVAHANPKQFGSVLADAKLVHGWPERPEVVALNLKQLLMEGDTRWNLELKDGDVVYVPESATSSVLEFLQRALSPWSAAISAGGNYAAVREATKGQ
jgi:protein involved in polysaccharide export with SLBB domain